MKMNNPLADRVRPREFEDFLAQEDLIGENGVITKFIKSGFIPSIIFWGPPGVGKTTLANIIAKKSKREIYTLNAINSGVKEIREIISSAQNKGMFGDGKAPILFIDEIHRFSKSQQDSLLNAVEKGIVTLIGATTENPGFEVISALLSRCQVFVLKPLDDKNLQILLEKVIIEDVFLSKKILS